jgi:hypothetical protein
MKKRLVLSFIFAILCFVGISADNNTNENCEKVSMVAYEQRWIDSKATIALRNNTDEEVTSVSFTLEYLDMNDNPRSYGNYTQRVEIAPGMTKEIDIPAYKHKWSYHYYLTPDSSHHPTFKVRYKFQEINTDNGIGIFDNPKFSGLIMLTCMLLIPFTIGFYILAFAMARKRKRNIALWIGLSFILSPVVVCVILLIIGKDEYSDKTDRHDGRQQHSSNSQ